MALVSTDLALLTARAGCGRAGACRAGFVPFNVRLNRVGEVASPVGTLGPFYLWIEVKPRSIIWTRVA